MHEGEIDEYQEREAPRRDYQQAKFLDQLYPDIRNYLELVSRVAELEETCFASRVPEQSDRAALKTIKAAAFAGLRSAARHL